MMNHSNILLLKDDLAEAEMVKFALDKGNLAYSLERVGDADEFVAYLASGKTPDLILADYGVRDMDGLSILETVHEHVPEVPLIFITSVSGEDRMIESLEYGATDYVSISRLSYLVPAIYRALREAAERSEHRRSAVQLRESQAQLRALSVYLQHAREEERTHIAREVHDELGQALAVFKMDIAWLSRHTPDKPPAVAKRLKTMGRYIDATILTVRRIITELRPGILDDLGLVAAIEWQSNEFQNRTGIACVVRSNLTEEVLEDSFKTAFFRIFQETLTNIIRHANATAVQVNFTLLNNCLVLTVQDNGRGIAKAEIENTFSVGLLGMRERVAKLGGSILFEGDPGRGTTVTVSIPCGRSGNSKGVSNENSSRRRSRSRA
ncbi:MAG: response regulator [Opitutales bacterium]|nr:response regulator [Opitutales bacterium]